MMISDRQRRCIRFIERTLAPDGIVYKGEDDRRAASEFISRYIDEARKRHSESELRFEEFKRRMYEDHPVAHIGGMHHGYVYFSDGRASEEEKFLAQKPAIWL